MTGSAPGAGDALAVVGLSCRVPGASNPDEFWRMLTEGRDAVQGIPRGRESPVPGGFLDNVAEFDAAFFSISPHEAAAMDPQQRLILELAWEVLEDAGIVPATLRGTRTGIWVGATADDYALLTSRAGAAALGSHTLTGLQRSMIANRVSYLLGIRGPSMTVDCGQSSSLAAVHLACESLRRGDCTLALAAGVQLNLASDAAQRVGAIGALSPDGKCYTFDSRANGYVRGEGGGAVVIKPLAHALADGDLVRAVILGSAVNNDGGGPSLTAPNVEAQQEVIRLAWRAAGVDLARANYVELHGTGTPAGDAAEASALGAVFGSVRPVGRPLPVGSVKTNIGHLEGAAGIAGLLKTVLGVQHGQIPASLNFDAAQPGVPLAELNLMVQDRLTPWAQDPRLAGISSFGLGGTNCHVVVANSSTAVDAEQSPVPAAAGPWLVHARDQTALATQAAHLAAHVRSHPDLRPADVGFSLATNRSVFEHRAAVTAADRHGLLAGLDALAAGEPASGVVTGYGTRPRTAVFVFPGQGSQWPLMARALLREQPAFASAIRLCAQELDSLTGWSLVAALNDEPGAASFDQVDVVQPALFAVMVALAELWRAHGVEPAAVVGHSQGEVAAAYVAGALSLADAARIVVVRSCLVRQELSGRGGMASVLLGQDELSARLLPWEGRLTCAAANSPDETVIAGDTEALDETIAVLTGDGVRARRLLVDYPSHSPLVEVLAEKLAGELAGIRPTDSRVPFYSGLTGARIDTQGLDAAYWYRNLRYPVRFTDAVAAQLAAGLDVFIEVSPHPVLLSAVRATADAMGHQVALTETLMRDNGGSARFHAALGAAHTAGVEVRWPVVWEGTGARRVPLPTYAFQRQHHWLASPGAPEASAPVERGRVTVRLVAAVAAAVLGHSDVESVSVERPFRDLGMDSLLTLRMSERLTAASGIQITAKTLFDHPTCVSLADHLAVLTETQESTVASTVQGLVALDEPIAVVGLACRFPGADDPDAFWRLLEHGGDAVRSIPGGRWGKANAAAEGRAGLLSAGVEGFDAQFFGIAPKEAVEMDPQQRIMLEVAWEALEDAGMADGSLRGSKTGIFVGVSWHDFAERSSASPLSPYTATGRALNMVPNRLSYFLGLRGPSMAVDTACSSSLLAVHLACQSLRTGEAAAAIAGGVSLLLAESTSLALKEFGGLSADGRCKTFDAGADGYVRGEGCGAVVLKLLSVAVADGNDIWCTIRGSATNNDGQSNGLTAPNPAAQQEVLHDAYRRAGVAPADIHFVETHGTGTALGDHIETAALGAVLGKGRPAAAPLVLGAVKTNIGHLEAAAGIAGLIKTALVLKHRTVPPNLHCETPDPRIDFTSLRLCLPDHSEQWPAGRPSLAGVSSFGWGGSNVHMVLEGWNQSALTGGSLEATEFLVTLSAKTPQALRDLAGSVATAIDTHPGPLDVPDLAAATARRSGHQHRLAVVTGMAPGELANPLRRFAEDGQAPGVTVSARPVHRRPSTAFLFADEVVVAGDEVLQLLAEEPAFRACVEKCDQAFLPLLGRSVLKELTEPQNGGSAAGNFTVQAAIVDLLRSWGVTPDVVAGLGWGRVAGACTAGILSLSEAAQCVADGRAEVAEGLGFLGATATADGDIWARLAEQGVEAVVEVQLRPALHDLSPGDAPSAVPSGHATTVRGRLLVVLAKLFVRGVPVRPPLTPGRRVVKLPSYPWQRSHYPLPGTEAALALPPSAPQQERASGVDIALTVRRTVAETVGLPEDAVGKDQPLNELGMTSVMALELRNRWEAVFGLQLPPTTVWNYPTVDAVAGLIGRRLTAEQAAPVGDSTQLELERELAALARQMENLT